MSKITAELTSGTQVTLFNGRHTWHADEPPEANGTDIAPNPTEHLLGALAACSCITLSLYCQHKGIALKSVSTSYEFGKVATQNAGDSGSTTRDGRERITSHIRIAGDFDAAQRKRLAQIAERCPVHRTLSKELLIEDRVEFA